MQKTPRDDTADELAIVRTVVLALVLFGLGFLVLFSFIVEFRRHILRSKQNIAADFPIDSQSSNTSRDKFLFNNNGLVFFYI
jgi:hypothetical protein